MKVHEAYLTSIHPSLDVRISTGETYAVKIMDVRRSGDVPLSQIMGRSVNFLRGAAV